MSRYVFYSLYGRNIANFRLELFELICWTEFWENLRTPCFSSSSAGVKVLVDSIPFTPCQSLDRIASKTFLDVIFI